jgi:hypothetical protein
MQVGVQNLEPLLAFLGLPKCVKPPSHLANYILIANLQNAYSSGID